jgi:PAS domain S-box-containing protein
MAVIPPTLPSDLWRAKLREHTARLAQRLQFLGLQVQRLGPSAGSILHTALDELIAAAAYLRDAETALAASDAQLAAAQDAVAAAQRDQQALFAIIPDAYLVTDAAGIIHEANHAVSALVGYARTYVLGKPLAALVHLDAADTFHTRFHDVQTAAEDRLWEWELPLRARYPNAATQVVVRVAPVRDQAGMRTGYRWLLRDVTVEKATAAALQRLEAEQAQTLRTRTMELEAIVRMKDAALAQEQAARARAEAALPGESQQVATVQTSAGASRRGRLTHPPT